MCATSLTALTEKGRADDWVSSFAFNRRPAGRLEALKVKAIF